MANLFTSSSVDEIRGMIVHVRELEALCSTDYWKHHHALCFVLIIQCQSIYESEDPVLDPYKADTVVDTANGVVLTPGADCSPNQMRAL